MPDNYSLPTTHYKLVAIVGPTASGKSALALRIAKDFDGEIISADSLTVYKNMDIGTAKPTKAEQRAIKHWGFDIVGPGQRYTAAEFKEYALKVIDNIGSRRKLPVLVGGSGLYADSVLYDYKFSPAGSERDSINPRHRKALDPRPDKSIIPGVLMIGVLPDDEVLKQRITQRVGAMFEDGLVLETKALVKQYGADSLIAKAKVAYGPVIEYLNGGLDLDQAKARLATAHWQYARRQKTWFKRNPDIKWFSTADVAYKFVKRQLLNT